MDNDYSIQQEKPEQSGRVSNIKINQRFFSADFHLNSPSALVLNNRPFKSVSAMNLSIIDNVNTVVSSNNILIHAGDFCQYGNSSDDEKNIPIEILKTISDLPKSIHPTFFIKQMLCNFINIAGNHDNNNKVKSLGTGLRCSLGKMIKDVSISHYPSIYYKKEEDKEKYFSPGDVHLHGHVHTAFKSLVDTKNQVLNINVGLDVWNYCPVSEFQLISYIHQIYTGQVQPDVIM